MKFLYMLVAVGAGVLIEVYTVQIVRLFGSLSWAERYFGPGGTYFAWKLIGIIAIIVGFAQLR